MMTRLKQKWAAAKSEPERGQIAGGEVFPVKGTGFYTRHYFEHGLWLTPGSWALGATFDSADWLPGGIGGRRGITIQVGCVLYVFDVCQPLVRDRTAVSR